MTAERNGIEASYIDRRDRAASERDDLARRAGHISNLRLLSFLAAVGTLVWAELQPDRGALALLLLALSLLAFLALIVRHSRLTQRRLRAAERAAVNTEALARMARDWDALPAIAERGPPGHPYAHDLDVFGHGSLLRFLGTAGTGVGRARLRRWLLEPAAPDEATRRQEAVRELAPMLDFRQELEVAGRLAGQPDRAALDAFLGWAEDRPWLSRRPLLLWVGRLLPAATIALGLLQLEDVVERPWWILTLAATVAMAFAFGRRIHRLFDRASLGDANLRHFAALVDVIGREEFVSGPLREARAALVESDAARQLERLAWLTGLAELRHGGLFYAIVHAPTLWDFHVLRGLERWQERAGRHAREWVRHVARVDALAALSAPLHDEEGWSMPELGGDGDVLTGEALAHPLLAAGDRVPNDVELGPPGRFLMVTGSNMSGKSTLLRAIGVNAVLSQAGGPVCARRLVVPPVQVYTSMRVEDSLERGVSLFMAELQRLKKVVDAADAADSRILLYLLDEILHGTNTAERQIAVREVIAHLLRSRAIGAISTHDLELASAGPLAGSVVPVHFRETVHPEGHEPPMTFDYRLREGIATSTNALKLVRLVGLTGRAEADPEPAARETGPPPR